MGNIDVVFMVIGTVSCVLAIVFVALYVLNKAVDQSVR